MGDIEVISLYDGVWEKPHDENFIKGVSVEQTKAALRAGGLTDAHVPIPFTIIAVNTGGRLVLIDSGTGGGQAGGPKAGVLAQSMAAAGLDPKAVKTIVISHFHGDHIFGLMAKDTNAQMFPDAEIIVPAAELKWWTQPVKSIPAASPGTCSARAGDVADLEERQAGRRRGRAGAGRARHSRVRPYPGPHRASHQLRRQAAARHGRRHQHSRRCSSRIRSGRRPSTTCPTMAVETRKKLFDRAIADKAMVAGYHWGLPNVGTIAKDGNGYAFTPAAAS